MRERERERVCVYVSVMYVFVSLYTDTSNSLLMCIVESMHEQFLI